jgi:hypothetical protein
MSPALTVPFFIHPRNSDSTMPKELDTRAMQERAFKGRRWHNQSIAIVELCDTDKMSENLRGTQTLNGKTLKPIYIGRCFSNDTECLEELVEMCTKITANSGVRARV